MFPKQRHVAHSTHYDSFDFGWTFGYNTARDAEVAEWQTRRSQKPLRATSCGFDSRLRHHSPNGQASSRGVAQPGRAPRSGRGGRWFKSTRPDHARRPGRRFGSFPANFFSTPYPTYAIISPQSKAQRGPRMSTKRPSISAFFPAYNDGGTIGSLVVTALATLAELTDDYEVIVVENGSIDYTVEVLRELERQYDHFRAL